MANSVDDSANADHLQWMEYKFRINQFLTAKSDDSSERHFKIRPNF